MQYDKGHVSNNLERSVSGKVKHSTYIIYLGAYKVQNNAYRASLCFTQ